MTRTITQTFRFRAFRFRATLVAASFAMVGCQTYQAKVSVARDHMKRGTPAEALKTLEPLANTEDRDQLVYLLDYGTVLQQTGRYKESAKTFTRAEKIADVQDYHSLSKVASSLVLSEEMIQYKGDDYEKVLINALNAINYLEMGDLDEALVEVRRLNQKLYKYKYEAKRDYEQNPFAFYLAALIYEASQKWDDAYISYKSAYQVLPSYEPLREDLIRSAMRAQRPEDVAEWHKKFPEVQVKTEWKDRSKGEIVLVFMQGWGPRKSPRPENPRFPQLMPVGSSVQTARLETDGGLTALSRRIFNVQQIAIKTLNDDYARLVATRVAGIATKAVVADQIGQKNKLLGAVAWVAMNATDRADLRQWSTLPETFQVARLAVPAGVYKVKAVGVDYGNNNTTDQMPEKELEVRPGRKAFISWRSVR